MSRTTISISAETKKLLDELKIYRRETYEDVIRRLIDAFKKPGGEQTEFRNL